MSAIVLERPTTEVAALPEPARIPLTRITRVELAKMFDTRSGWWLMASIVITSVIATAAVILFAPEEVQTYESFATAIGFPMAMILPMVAALSVTSEWSQRTGLTTFTLVPHRGRVIWAKAIASVLVGVVSVLIALAVGAVGNVLGTAITGTETVWNLSLTECLLIVLANVIGLLVGFMLGVVVRNSAGALVAYFVYALLLPTVFGVLAEFQVWFRDLQGWIDLNYAQGALFSGTVTGTDWAHLAVATSIWLVAPLAVGLTVLLRSEMK